MLRERYEHIRKRALERTALAGGSEVVMRRGMRSWMEAGWRQEATPEPAVQEEKPQLDQAFQPIVTVWASVFVSQAERSYGGQREA